MLGLEVVDEKQVGNFQGENTVARHQNPVGPEECKEEDMEVSVPWMSDRLVTKVGAEDTSATANTARGPSTTFFKDPDSTEFIWRRKAPTGGVAGIFGESDFLGVTESDTSTKSSAVVPPVNLVPSVHLRRLNDAPPGEAANPLFVTPSESV